jgi:parvulin-like peptidyl-prolyl isomerase
MRTSLASLLLLLTSACASTSYLAKVNGDPITGSDLKKEFGLRHAALEKYLSEDAEVRKYLDNAIDRKLLVQEGTRIGLQDSPEIRDVVAENRSTLLVRMLLRQEVDLKSKPTEAEVQAAWEQTGEMLRVRHVTLATQAEAEEVRKQVVAGEDMEELVRTVSIHKDATQGGLVVVRWGIGEDWETNVLPLQGGELAPVFQSRAGWEVARVEERKTFDKAPVESGKKRISGILEPRKKAAREKAFLSEMRARYGATVLECDLSLPALKAAVPGPGDAVCATWSGGKLTQSNVLARLDVKKLEAEPADSYPESIRVAVSDLLLQDILVAEAVARGYDKDPDFVTETRTRSDRLVYNQLLSRYVLVNVAPTDEQVKTYVETHANELLEPESRIIRQVGVKTEPDAAKIRAKLDEGATIDDALKETDVVAAASGTVAVTRADLPASAEPIFTAKAGEVVGPMPVKGGFFFAKVITITPERKFSEAEGLKAARTKLQDENSRREYEEWTAKLRALADIEVNQAGIRAFIESSKAPALPIEGAPPVKAPAGTSPATPPPAAATPAAPPEAPAPPPPVSPKT